LFGGDLFGRGAFMSEIRESCRQKKWPESKDFEVKVFGAGADVIFKPTSSYYWFSRFADFADIVRYGHLSQSANVRHTGLTGDTDGYDPSEVLTEARRVALRAAQDTYENNG
jgi:hypothetical protein